MNHTPDSDQERKESLAEAMKSFLDQGKSEDARESTSSRVKMTGTEDLGDNTNEIKADSMKKVKTGDSQREEVDREKGRSTNIIDITRGLSRSFEAKVLREEGFSFKDAVLSHTPPSPF